jgi:hypothetical protein
METKLVILFIEIIFFFTTKIMKKSIFLSEFVSDPIAKLHVEDGQSVDAKIFHFQPESVHAHIQVFN